MNPINDEGGNIASFYETYGKKGFLELYFTNYIFELLMAYLRSKSDDIAFDGGYQYHFGKSGELLSPTNERRFRDDVKRECAKKAKAIVAELDRRGILDKFGDMQSLTGQAPELVNEAVKEAFESVFKTKWSK